ncbi:MAG: glycosyltransferase family 39 protein [Chloroflexi bacterium]|nr:glycosyltransferase family 39 protein [Chloroflexota bacterium]
MTDTKKEKSVREAVRAIRVPHLLFLSTLLIAAFFRFYHIAQVPAEPFSDHAEKILDIYDITQGEARIFFPRNTGREALQFYWSLLVAAVFGTGLSFQTLKIGAAILGFITLPFIYLLGAEIVNRRAGLLAMLFAGIAYWPNVISRVGLRFPLYPLFVAATLFFLLRGLRTNNRNDFLLSGLFLGLGLHGYTPFRVVPLLILLTIIIHLLYHRSLRFTNYVLLFTTALIVFLPLFRYALANPDEFWFRAGSRALVENPLPIFFSNLWNALLMFNVNDGNIFVNSIADRPALDIVTGALFVLGLTLLLTRRSFSDLWLAAAIVTLILPSVFSLAFPSENPALNRAGGALVPVFVVVGMALDGLLTRLAVGLTREGERVIAAGVVGILFAASAVQNYDLVFRQYDEQYNRVVWTSSEMGAVIREFGNPDRVWIVPYEQWVDTRLPALWAGLPNRDLGLPRSRLADTLQLPAPKLFIFKASPLAEGFDDKETLAELQRLYPQGELTLHESELWWQSFWVYFVAAP